MYIKLLGSVLVIISCAGYGFFKGQECKNHLKNIETLKQIANTFASETVYRKLPIADLASMIAARTEEPYSSWLKNLSASLKNNTDLTMSIIWENEAKHLSSLLQLPKEDAKDLQNLGTQLTHYNIKMQESSFLWFAQKLDERRTKLVLEVNEKQRLCNSLGVITGIFLVILLI